jgi:hypothetical protein
LNIIAHYVPSCGISGSGGSGCVTDPSSFTIAVASGAAPIKTVTLADPIIGAPKFVTEPIVAAHPPLIYTLLCPVINTSGCGGGGGIIGIVCGMHVFPVLIAGRPLIYTLDEYPAPGGCTGFNVVNVGIGIGWISWFA